MFQVFADEPAQRGWWFFAFQSGRFHDLGEHCLSILFQFLHEVVASPAEAMQGRLLTPADSANSFSVARGRLTMTVARALRSCSSWAVRDIGSLIQYRLPRIVQKKASGSKGDDSLDHKRFL
ncbi:hypothetical protein D9M68_921730 [compost metagenome]